MPHDDQYPRGLLHFTVLLLLLLGAAVGMPDARILAQTNSLTVQANSRSVALRGIHIHPDHIFVAGWGMVVA